MMITGILLMDICALEHLLPRRFLMSFLQLPEVHLQPSGRKREELTERPRRMETRRSRRG